MNRYLIYMPGGEPQITQVFPDAHQKTSEDLWAVGTSLRTCTDVCTTVGIMEGKSGVLVPMEEYYGRFDRALWQRLEAWGNSP